MNLRPLSRLKRDERGASVIEVALFAPVLGVMLMGITDLAMGYARKLSLEQAAYRSLEKVAVGTVRTDYSFLRAEAASAAGVAESAVTVDNWLECDRARQTNFDGSCAAGTMTSRYVQVTINASYTPRFSVGPLATSVPLQASAALRIQ